MAKKIVVKTQTKEVQLVLDGIKIIGEVYEKLLKILPSFDITSTKVLPYGLKPHTRSVAWIVEQVIVQQSKYNAKKLGIDGIFQIPNKLLYTFF